MANKKMDRDFFKKDTIHGLMKRIMYKKYLQAYIAKTQYEKVKYAYKTIIIDAFAGAGRYGPQYQWPAEIEKYGSPLIALMVALGFSHRKQKMPNVIWGWEGSCKNPETELRGLSKSNRMESVRIDDSCDIELIFIESNNENYKELTCNVEILLIRFIASYYPSCRYGRVKSDDKTYFSFTDHPFSIHVRIINGSFETFEPPPDLEKSGVVSLTFLDPFGYTKTPMRNVQRFSPGPRNDILINFMSSYVNRQVKRNPKGVAALFGIDLEQIAERDKESLSDFVDNIIRSYEKPNEVLPLKRAKVIAKNYEQFLKKKTGTKFSLTFEMRRENNDILYHIIYITNHIEGVKSMKESMNRCSQVEDGMEMSEFYILRKGQKINLGNMDNPEKVANTVYEHFKGREEVKLCRISNFVWIDTPYLFRTKPLGKLEKGGKISVRHVCPSNSQRKRRRYTFPEKPKEGNPVMYYLTFSSENVTSDHPEQSFSSTADVLPSKVETSGKSSKGNVVKKKKVMKRKENGGTCASVKMNVKEKFENDARSIEKKVEKITDLKKREESDKIANKKIESVQFIENREKERKQKMKLKRREKSEKRKNGKEKLTSDRTSKENEIKKKMKLKRRDESKECDIENKEIEGKLTSKRKPGEKETKKKAKLKRRDKSKRFDIGEVETEEKVKSDRKSKEKERKMKMKLKRREGSHKCASLKVENKTGLESARKSNNKEVKEKRNIKKFSVERKRKKEIDISSQTNQKKPKLS
ncbi:biorientation of chromosomes in cell division protein 1-like 1 [Mercenaria mercenaria]|uniref:biorientation of chromosomes in cell division protein 1-like 1 n=1 Tax=Mercenaria mercenaria TaxID=6596 RepID=UPI00234E9ED5|nr:biorientation of chromosomes in cell division protein 1-like 1 [Mercenaria mercenaria]